MDHRVANPLSLLSKFKLFDNLRRSLVPVALLVLFGLNWTILPETLFLAWYYIGYRDITSSRENVAGIVRKPNDMLPSQHVANY